MTEGPSTTSALPRFGFEPTEVESSGVTAADARLLDVVLDEAILRCDATGRVLEAFGPPALMPAPPEGMRGLGIADLFELPLAMRQAWLTALDRALTAQRPQICAYTLDTGNGARAFEARMLPMKTGSIAIAIRDVTERDLLRRRVEQYAVRDELTGLGNLRSLRDRLDRWMRPGSRSTRVSPKPVVLLLIDLDRFKQSNDLHGRSIGDSLLRLAAQRIRRETLRELRGRAFDIRDAASPSVVDERDDPEIDSTLAVVRIGGDQFAVAWRLADRSEEADRVAARGDLLADRLIAALGVPTRIASQSLFVRASIGSAVFPADADDPAALFSLAEAALRRAKLAGRNQARRHGDDDASARSSLLPPGSEDALRSAIASDQFRLVYQPKFELASSLSTLSLSADGDDAATLAPGAIVAVEALVRWHTPDGTLLIPQEFIPLAETSGMIRPLGDWVLRTALAEVARFAEQGAARVGVTVNVSLLQLHDRNFVQTVESALKETGFAANELTIEIAETAFLEDIRLVADAVAELSAMGVRLAIDHFGVGTAGLVALKSLPVDEIKIDRSFIAGAAIDAFDATIVAGLIEMAHDLGKTVTAEGVERVDQIASLGLMRCDAIQGYFVGEPMTAPELVAATDLWRKTPRAAR